MIQPNDNNVTKRDFEIFIVNDRSILGLLYPPKMFIGCFNSFDMSRDKSPHSFIVENHADII